MTSHRSTAITTSFTPQHCRPWRAATRPQLHVRKAARKSSSPGMRTGLTGILTPNALPGDPYSPRGRCSVSVPSRWIRSPGTRVHKHRAKVKFVQPIWRWQSPGRKQLTLPRQLLTFALLRRRYKVPRKLPANKCKGKARKTRHALILTAVRKKGRGGGGGKAPHENVSVRGRRTAHFSLFVRRQLWRCIHF